MSHDICGDRCEVEEIKIEERSYLKEIKNNSINIPNIKVSAPVIFNSGISEDEVLDNLNKGVVYYSSSDLPSEKGVTMLLGHSSNYWWAKSEYNNVFALIPELKVGDEINLYYQNNAYNYKVKGSKVIDASSWKEIKNPDFNSGLALLTCWPLGSSLKRYIVYAQRNN